MAFGAYSGGYCYDVTGDYAASFASASLAGAANLAVLAGLALHLRWHRSVADSVRRGGPAVLPAPSAP
jgi:hypothetical protein